MHMAFDIWICVLIERKATKEIALLFTSGHFFYHTYNLNRMAVRREGRASS